MITIPRRLARRLRDVIRCALAAPRLGPGPSVALVSSSNELVIYARNATNIVTYTEPGNFTPDAFAIPLDGLTRLAGVSQSPVVLQADDPRVVIAHWQHTGIDEQTLIERVAIPDRTSFPTAATQLWDNPGHLLTALRDASDIAHPASSHYALGQIQLRGTGGEIAATDGQQLLLQTGFGFPWEEEIRIERSRVFGCDELVRANRVKIGLANGWITLVVGPWTLQFIVQTEGRFPKIEDHVPQSQAAHASCQLSQRDALRLRQLLRLLPGDKEANSPITIDLNGDVRVRARSLSLEESEELTLDDDTPTGEPLRLAVNRCHLERVGRLGLRELHLFGADKPLLARDDTRWYVWMPLAKERIVRPRPPVMLVRPRA